MIAATLGWFLTLLAAAPETQVNITQGEGSHIIHADKVTIINEITRETKLPHELVRELLRSIELREKEIEHKDKTIEHLKHELEVQAEAYKAILANLAQRPEDDTLSSTARKQMTEGDLAAADRTLRKSIDRRKLRLREQQRWTAEDIYTRGSLKATSGDNAEACKLFSEAIELNPPDEPSLGTHHIYTCCDAAANADNSSKLRFLRTAVGDRAALERQIERRIAQGQDKSRINSLLNSILTMATKTSPLHPSNVLQMVCLEMTYSQLSPKHLLWDRYLLHTEAGKLSRQREGSGASLPYYLAALDDLAAYDNLGQTDYPITWAFGETHKDIGIAFLVLGDSTAAEPHLRIATDAFRLEGDTCSENSSMLWLGLSRFRQGGQDAGDIFHEALGTGDCVELVPTAEFIVRELLDWRSCKPAIAVAEDFLAMAADALATRGTKMERSVLVTSSQMLCDVYYSCRDARRRRCRSLETVDLFSATPPSDTDLLTLAEHLQGSSRAAPNPPPTTPCRCEYQSSETSRSRAHWMLLFLLGRRRRLAHGRRRPRSSSAHA